MRGSRLLLVLLPLAGLGACKGLNLEAGNAYPCDFNAGPGVRDLACLPGDVCASSNVCTKYFYEGPRFEATPTVPSYGPGTSEGEVLHPLVLDKPYERITAEVPADVDRMIIAQRAVTNTLVRLSGGAPQGDVTLPQMLPAVFGTPVSMQPFSPSVVPLPAGVQPVAVADDRGQLVIGLFNLGTPRPLLVTRPNSALPFTGRNKVLPIEPPVGVRGKRALPFVWHDEAVAVVEPNPTLTGAATVPLATANGPVLDIAGFVSGERMWLLMLEEDRIELVERTSAQPTDGGTERAVEWMTDLVPTGSTTTGTLRTDPATRIVAAARRVSRTVLSEAVVSEVLSTFQLNIGAAGPTLSSPWPDCTPCPPNYHVAIMTPSVRSGAPTVELVCTSDRPRLPPLALRVVGSVALDQGDACLAEALELPVPFVRVASPSTRLSDPVAWEHQAGALLGGKRGEIWSGETLSTLQPLYLDRVPLDVAPVMVLDHESVLALTDDYLSILEPADLVIPGRQRNGFKRISNAELGASDDARLAGLVHGVNGWGVTAGGEIIALYSEMNDAGTVRNGIEVGPTLVAANGDPIRDSIGGEGFIGLDGGLQGLFVAADDSLYLLPDPEAYLGVADVYLTPDLTPEPSVPIRSLALERTPLGTSFTEAGVRARGYLVTSRNVYDWRLGGNPVRWSSQPIDLGGGEPVEVWFDRERSALGRVGFTDGQIFTLPGGFELAEPLPANEDGIPQQVWDYENLGGWPVAYGSTGLFIAGWDLVGEKVQNRFPDGGVNRPMTWREVTLPDGSKPWMPVAGQEAVNAKLFVTVDEAKKTYKLLLFLDDKVLQVATHVRQ